MKVSFFLLIALFSMTFTSAQNSFKLKKDHDAIQVSDLSVSARFYGKVLGLKEIPNGGLGDHIRWFELGEKVQIHLIEGDKKIEKTKGVHFALNTEDLEAFMDHLREKKVPFENWPGEQGVTNTRPDGIKQIYLQDPDGYWIEVNDNRL
ncbi:VOC family protein [Gramella sp. GC03-9]|uniref:VOC family protein n=1 Tax=Christiangramia oceanisediminis TaxID=2920386 RepID=A0A9X2I893_9FLAO|nr:VOC family protein [Gramella oceanisediminis]MCP9199644.1 VOC family protein [Gramella oceanisediminis]